MPAYRRIRSAPRAVEVRLPQAARRTGGGTLRGLLESRRDAGRQALAHQNHPGRHHPRGCLQDRRGGLDRRRATGASSRVRAIAGREGGVRADAQQSLPLIERHRPRQPPALREGAPSNRTRHQRRRHHPLHPLRPRHPHRAIGAGTLGYDPDLKPYPYDPARARELLAEAGFPGGVNVTCYNLTTPREPNFKEVGETIFAYLNEAGIRCRIVQLEYGAWIAVGRRFSRPHMDGIWSTMWGQGLPGDPADAWSGHVHTAGDGWGTYSYHADPELDAMIVQLRKTMDETQRIALIRAIAARKHEQVAGGFPTYRPMITLAWRDDVDFEPWPAAFWRSMRGMKGKAR